MATLKKVAAEVRPTGFVDCGDFFAALLAAMKQRDPAYSYARFAEDLGYDAASNLHSVVKGRRPLTVKAAAKIAAALELPPHQSQYFTLLVRLKATDDVQERQQILEEVLALRQRYDSGNLSPDQLEFCREWHHLVVRELLGVPGVDQDPASIARAIVPRVRAAQVKKSIELLLRLGMVRYDVKACRLVPSESAVQTGAETEGLLVVRYHHAMLDLAKGALASTDEAERDVSANTFRVSSKQLGKIKERIYELQMEILNGEAPTEQTDRIYQLNFQLFPLTAPLARRKTR